MSSLSQSDPAAVRAAVEAVAKSPGFRNSDRMVRFLRFVVEKSLEGESATVKEYTLGVEVFDRPADFDPKTDTIVRVEARRLRRKLQEYYQAGGAADAVRIEIPTPGYTPVFVEPETSTQAIEPVAISTRPPRSWRLAVGGVFLVLGAAAGGFWLYWGAQAGKLTSVAVLPFANLSGDPNQDYFSDGFTEEVIDRLTSIEDLRVAARTSSFEFKGKGGDIRGIGEKLRVDALVEGSVRRSGSTVRITAQLIRTSDGYHIWSRSWDRTGTDVLAMESDVAGAIAESFRRTLKPAARTAPSLEAHDLYLLGRHHWNVAEPDDLLKAIDYFERAIALAPDYALAYSGLSEAYSYLIDLDYAPTSEIAPKAKAAAEKALALDESLAEAHTSLGLERMEGEWDFAGAEKEFQRAIALKPRFAYGVHWYAHFLDYSGKSDVGCAQMKRSVEMDPLSRMFQVDVAMCYYGQRRFDEAWTQSKNAREIDPQWPFIDVLDAVLYLAKKDAASAREAVRRAEKSLGPIPPVIAVGVVVDNLAGDTQAVERWLSGMKEGARSHYVPAYAFALAYYAAGQRDEGLEWLKRSFENRNGALLWMRNTPLFDIVRQDARAVVLLDHVGDRMYRPRQ